LTAIREDIERLRTDKAEQRQEPVHAEPARPAERRRAESPREESDTRRNVSRPAPPSPRIDKSRKKKKRKGSAPVQDEWGFFDPDQCGFAALLAKLDEITEDDAAGTQSA